MTYVYIECVILLFKFKPNATYVLMYLWRSASGQADRHSYDQRIYCEFLALLCATAQQSYCRHAGVRRPSVKPVFSELVMQINAKFGGKVPFHHISRSFFLFVFQNFAFLIFYEFFSFSSTWDYIGEKTSNDISSENT